MAIDTSIYGQIQQPQIESPINALAKVAALQQAQNQNRLADLAFADREDQTRQTNALNSLYQGAIGPDGKIDRTKILTGAAQQGLGSKIPGLQKQWSEQDEADAKVGKTKADTLKTGLEAANLALTQHRAMLNNVNDPQTAKQWLVAGYQNPDTKQIFERFGPVDEALRRFDASVKDPASFAKWKMGASMNADDLVKYTTPDANAVLSAKTSKENTASNNAVTMRGQDITDRRARQTAADGKAPAGYRFKADGSLEAIPGGPADAKLDKDTKQRTQDAKDVLGLLDEADKILPNATGGYVGMGLDAAARAFGKTTEGDAATARLSTIEGQLVGKMPKFSGPTSDRDAQLYRQAAGDLANPALPVARRQAASNTVRTLHEKALGLAEGSSIKGKANSNIDSLLDKYK